MFLFDYPSQQLQDWLSQRWVMLWGRRVQPSEIPWLFGPFGEVDTIADNFLDGLAQEENLTIERDVPEAGMVDSITEMLGEHAGKLNPKIRAFYESTARYDMEVWSEWNALARPGGWLVQWLFSRRFQQLNLPMRPMDTALGIMSEIALLRESSGAIRYRLWYRAMKSGGEAGRGRVIFSGIYTTTTLPDGRACVKAIYPLPRGNATVILAPTVDERGNMELLARGRQFGEPGFYFLMRNRHRKFWAQLVRSFYERIRIYVDEEGILRADHTLVLWGVQAMRLHYKITRRGARENQPPPSQSARRKSTDAANVTA